MYSFGIILYEVFARRDPYEDDKDANEVIRLVANKTIRKRPGTPRNMPDKIKSLMSDCVEDDPEQRPSFEEVVMRLKRIESDSTHNAPLGKHGSNHMSLHDIFPKHIADTLAR